MRYLSVCSGIEAASAAWEPLGWTPVGFSEIEPFPCAVLAHHFPGVPNHGDLTQYPSWGLKPGDVDVLIGGTPCQSFSVAGLRGGLADARGNLALVFCHLVRDVRPQWVIWENVPGVLSSNEGRDFGSVLGALVELGYGVAYRVCDAQYFGVPQRRRRVFVVGYLGDWQPPASVLFEQESLRGNPAPSRKARKVTAAAAAEGTASGRGFRMTAFGQYADPDLMLHGTVGALCANDYKQAGNTYVETGKLIVWRAGDQANSETLVNLAGTLNTNVGQKSGILFQAQADVAGTLDANYGKGTGTRAGGREREIIAVCATGSVTHALTRSHNGATEDGTGRGTPIVPVAFHPTQDPIWSEDRTHALSTGSSGGTASIAVATAMQVRRLTPTECERLQGFPDGWTDIPYRGKPAADGPRYKALGNSMAVPVIRWLGTRIEQVTRNMGSAKDV